MNADNKKLAWHVYMLRCADGSLYTGITNNVVRRLEEHNCSNRLGAKYTRARRPVELVYTELVTNRSIAAQRECSIKKMSHQEKQELIDSANNIDEIL